MTIALQWANQRLETVCQLLGVSWADVVGSSRRAKVVRARRLAAYLLREWPGPGGVLLSFVDIAATFRKGEPSGPMKLHAAVERSDELRAEAEQLADLMGLVKRRTLLDRPKAEPTTGEQG